MSAWLLFIAGIVAARLVGPRDLPLGATCLGLALLFAGLQLGGIGP